MSYTVKRIIGDPFPEWGLYENERLIGKAYSAEKAAEFAASGDLAKALVILWHLTDIGPLSNPNQIERKMRAVLKEADEFFDTLDHTAIEDIAKKARRREATA